MNNLNCYYINKATCALIPISDEMTKVIELDDNYIVNESIRDIINESCKYFGSSYKGRVEGSKKMLNMNYKLPIVIEEFNNLIFFPTSSPRFGQCYWISLKNIDSYSKLESCSRIIFYSGVELEIENSYYSLENQIFRATMLESLLRKRRSS